MLTLLLLACAPESPSCSWCDDAPYDINGEADSAADSGADQVDSADTGTADTEDSADSADTGTSTDTSSPEIETWECSDGGERASYVHRFETRLDFGTAAEVGLWVLYDPGYLDYYEDLYGYQTAAAQYAAAVSTDADGYVLGYCLWTEVEGYRGFYTERLVLVSSSPG